jgi:hypothetical protein
LLVLITHQRPVVALAMEVPHGAVGAKAADASTWLGDSARSLLQDLVVCDTDASIAGSAAPGGAALAPGSSSTVSPGVSRLYFPGSPGSPPLPINWRRVEDEAESVCSQVAATERFLHEMLASVHQKILCPVWVSLKGEIKSYPLSHGLLHAFSFLL